MPSRTALRVPPALLLALFAARDIEAFIEAAFAVLRATVACDFTSAFYRSAGNALLKGRDSKGRRYDSEFMRRHVELNPAIPLVMAQRGIRLLATGTGLRVSARALKQTAFYLEVMQPLGWRHSVALCFWGNPPADFPIVVAGPNRREGRPDFTRRDLARLEQVYPFLEAVVNQFHERERSRALTDGLGLTARTRPSEFAILDRDLRLVQTSPGVLRLCEAWNSRRGAGQDDSPSARRLPSEVVEGCRALRTEWEALLKVDPDVVSPRHRRHVVHVGSPERVASITMVSPAPHGLGEPMFVVEFHRGPSAAARLGGTISLVQSLTEAERAVALVLADGLSNQEIADHLGKTVHAVKFLLHRIYKRLGVPNRAALVAALRSGSGRSRRLPHR